MLLARIARSIFAVAAICVLSACWGSGRQSLEATEPIAERENGALVVRWSEGPDARLPIYAGPAPNAIDRTSPVAHLEEGRAEIDRLAFETRPYLEIALPGGEHIKLAERQIPLDGMDNFRDLGGYETADGRTTRWGRVYRSGELGDLTDADVETLHDLGINLVCDFRSPAEREESPDRLPTQNPPTVLQTEIYTPGVDPKELQDRIMSGDLEGLDLSE